MATIRSEVETQLEGLMGYLMCFEQVERFDAAVEQHLSISQLKLLFVLAQSAEPVSQKHLAERLRLSDAATGRAVDALHGRDMVHRREDSADRRVKRVTLAPAGRTAIEEVERRERARLRQFVDTLDTEDVTRLHEALGPILARPELRAYLDEGNA
ncbi:MAG: MarR family winged helix-turn-helix transcriptional regulator [Thermocrispum sp.]